MNTENLEKIGETILHSDAEKCSFTLEYKGTPYQFTCKNQNVNDTFDILAKSRRILSKRGLVSGESPVAEQLSLEIATIDQLLIERPEFIQNLDALLNFNDWDFLEQIYEEVAKFLSSFRKAE